MTDLRADVEWIRGQSRHWEELSAKLDAVSKGGRSVTCDADGVTGNNAGLNSGGFFGGDFAPAYHEFVEAFMARAAEGATATKTTGDTLIDVADTYQKQEDQSAHNFSAGN